MQYLHNAKTSGHLRRERTLHSISNRFYWPGMTDNFARWCQTCQPCSKKKSGPGQGKSPMQHHEVFGPMKCLALDIIALPPLTRDGKQYIMVVGDYFSKWKKAVALEDHTA